jgi:C-terminal, D2-small domain, of ClpB protein
LQREGLARRKCLLQVEEEALARIVDKGFDPRFGARVLKRAIERHLTRGVSARVAAGLKETFTHIHVYPAGQDIAVHVQGLAQVEPNPPGPDLSDEVAVLEKARRFAVRIMQKFEPLRPRGEIVTGSADHYAYFTLQAAADKLRLWIRRRQDAIEDAREQSRHFAQRAQHFRDVRHKSENRERMPHALTLQELAAAQDLQLYLKDLADRASRPGKSWNVAHDDDGETSGTLLDLVHYASYLQTLADCVAFGSPDQALIHLRAANPSDALWVEYLATKVLTRLFDNNLALEISPLNECGAIKQKHTLLLKGLAAVPLARLEEGTQLFCPNHGGVAPIQVMVWPVPDKTDPVSELEARLQERSVWQRRLASGEAKVDEDPFQLMPVVCLHQENGRRVDMRSGAVYPNVNKEWLLAALPMTGEFSLAPEN